MSLTPARWQLSVPEVLPSSIPACTTTPWLPEKRLCRSTVKLRFSLPTSILTTTPARVTSRNSRTCGDRANQLRKRRDRFLGLTKQAATREARNKPSPNEIIKEIASTKEI